MVLNQPRSCSVLACVWPILSTVVSISSFELQLRNKSSLDESQEDDDIDDLELTSNCLVPMVFNRFVKNVVLDVPDFSVSPQLVKRILDLNLLETLTFRYRFRNEEL
jgi:hypothetical protein